MRLQAPIDAARREHVKKPLISLIFLVHQLASEAAARHAATGAALVRGWGPAVAHSTRRAPLLPLVGVRTRESALHSREASVRYSYRYIVLVCS